MPERRRIFPQQKRHQLRTDTAAAAFAGKISAVLDMILPVFLQKCIGLTEMSASEKSSVCGKRARVRRLQDQVLWIDTPEMMDMKVIGDYLFHRMRDCSAVLCYNDQVAFQVVEMATERGIRVPEDLSVVGIDDAYLASVSKVPLTSFPHPKEKLGRKTAENLLKMIEDPSFDGNCLFDAEPVIRESIADLPVPREKAVL